MPRVSIISHWLAVNALISRLSRAVAPCQEGDLDSSLLASGNFDFEILNLVFYGAPMG